MKRLAGKVALITGAGRGVGAATAELLAADGCRVVVNDLDEEEAEQTVAGIVRQGGEAVAYAGDVTASAFPEQIIDYIIAGYGELDIIVNNAGYVWNGAMHRHSDEQFKAMLDIHAGAPFRLLRAYAPWLRETAKREIANDGRARCRKVVNISSLSGTEGNATQVGYSAGKAAVIGLTKALSKEWGRYNVTVNCVAFGHIATRLTQPYADEPPQITVAGRQYKVGLSEKQLNAMQRMSPLGRGGEPKDGAGAIYLFCIPESDYVSGQVLTCSGG